ncbi:MAG: glycosyltransferase family 4 protein [Patescibacteria group bacterium]|jgi:glycosyltransferase involved in cell wall biosynthesis
MKVLYVLEYYYPHVGGVETLFKELAEGCVQHGHQARVITASLGNTPSKEYINGVEIIRLNVPRIGRRYWFTILAFFPLFKHIAGFNIIHTTTYNAALPAWLVAVLTRKKIILTVHEVWGTLWYSFVGGKNIINVLHRFFEWFILKLPFDFYVTDSDYTEKALLKLRKTNLKTSRIYPGIDNDFFNPGNYSKDKIRSQYYQRNDFVCLFFGRPGWAKGVDYLVNSFSIVSKHIKGAKLLLLLSKDPYSRYQEIVSLISRLNLSGSVRVISSVPRNELPEYIASADCVVIPSLAEGFGFSAAEASAMEVPLVATDVGSLPEVVSGKVVFSPSAHSEALAQAILSMHAGQYTVLPKKKFVWSDSVGQYVSIYSNLAT